MDSFHYSLMESEQYFIALNLEAVVRKTDMHLRYLDAEGAIFGKTLNQLDQIFPSSLYHKSEHYGSYVYSYKDTIAIKDFLCLRNEILGYLAIEEKDYSIQEGLRSSDNDAGIRELVRICQTPNNYSDYSGLRLRWIQHKSFLRIKMNGTAAYTEPLSVTFGGIQIYESAADFITEMGGDLYLLERPLQRLLAPSNFANMISVCTRLGTNRTF